MFLSQGLQSRLDNSNLDPKEIKMAKEGQVSVHVRVRCVDFGIHVMHLRMHHVKAITT